MKIAAGLGIAILLIWGLAALAQLWWQPFGGEFFLKFSISCLLVGVISTVVALIRREYLDEQRQKRDKYLD